MIKLEAAQIAEHWTIIKEALVAAPPLAGNPKGVYHRILSQLMSGAYSCWFLLDDQEALKACVITGFFHDDLSGQRNLLLYLVYGYAPLTKRDKARGALAIFKYAKAKRCSQIVGYTNGGPLEEMILALQGDMSYKFFAVPVIGGE